MKIYSKKYYLSAILGLLAAFSLSCSLDSVDITGTNPSEIVDVDGDGIPDEIDLCRTGIAGLPSEEEPDTDGDGCKNREDLDDDNDGIPDINDNCPVDANSDQADADENGMGDACDSDMDSDGVNDADDNCPTVANPDQVDADTDDVGDLCDRCPIGLSGPPEMTNPDTDGDGCKNSEDPDDDNDTILDTAPDNCPLTANPDQTDTDGDTMGDACDLDDDNDTVSDVTDNCPLTANTDQADADGDEIGDACDLVDVSGVSAEPGTNEGEIDLSWTNPPDPNNPINSDFANVRITWSPIGGETQPVMVSGMAEAAANRTITGLTPGTAYTFTLIAVDASGNLSSGVEVSATASDIPPDPVTGVMAVDGTDEGDVDLSWTNPTNADFANVRITWSPTDGESQPVTLSGTSRTITGLTPRTAYTFTLIAVDNGGNDSSGVDVMITVADQPPGDVTGARAESGTNNGEVDLSWTNPTNADFANVRITWSPIDGESQPVTLSGTSRVITGLTPGTAYTFTLIAVDTGGNESPGVMVSAEPGDSPPDPVTGVTAVDGTNEGDVDLSWTNPTNADFANVRITWSPIGGESQPVTLSGTSRTITGLTPGTAYTFTLIAVDNGGNDSSGVDVMITVADPPPDPVTGVTAVDGTDEGDVDLSWTNPTNADFANVRITWSPTGGEIQPVTLSGTSRTITGLTPGTAYTFTLIAVDNGGNDSSGVDVMITVADPPPDPVTGVTAVDGTNEGDVDLSWTNPINADFANVRITWSPTGGESQPVTLSGTSRTITGLTSGTAYTFTLIAVDNGGNDSSGVDVMITVADPPPDPVTGLMAVDGTNDGDVDLSWTNPSDADFANVRITWSPTGGESQPVTLSGTSRTITGLTPGTAYTFTLIAVDNGGNDSSGVDVMITVADPPPDPVTGVTAVDGTNEGDVDLSWTNPTNADFANVRITWSPTDGESQPVTLSGTSRTITGLTPGTTYTFTLIAVDNGGNDSSGVDVMITVDDPPPDPVTGASAADGTNEGEVDLSWTNPINADFANVRITWSPTGGESQPVTLSGTSRTITGLTSGTAYTFTLIAVDNGGNDSSGVDVMITVADPPPDPVTGVTAVDGTDEGDVDLSWTNPTNADFANVRITWSPTGGESQPVTLSGTSRTITGLTSGTAYTFTLIAVDNGGNDSSGVDVMITVDDPPPGDVTGASAADGANEGDVDLSWTNPSDADFANVRITWSPIGGESQPVTLSGTSRTITGLTSGTAYTFTLTAVDNGGNDSSGVDVMITVADPPPDPVTGVTAVDGTNEGDVDLSWSNPTNADFANVRITWSPTGGESQPVTLSGTSRTITGLTPGTAYTFTLVAMDNGGNDSSGVNVMITVDDPPPDPVTGASAADGTNEGDVDLSWTNPTNADFANVRITWSPIGGESQPVTLSGTSRTVTGLTPGTAYTFTLTAVDNGGNDSSGVDVMITVADPPPDPVTGVTAVDGTDEGDVDLSWTNPTNADFANVRITWSPTGGESQPVTLSGTSRTITGLTSGTAYTFTLIAVDNGGNDSSGVDVMITVADPPPDPVTGLTAVDGTDEGDVDLSWTNPSDADFANVRITWSPIGGESQPVTLSGTSRTITGLTPGTAYTFTLTAVDNGGNDSSGVDVMITVADPPPDPVTGVTAVDGTNEGDVDLSWSNPTNADFANVRITWSPTGGESQPVTLSGTSRTITGLTPGTAYTFTLVAMDNGGNDSSGVNVMITVDDPPPDPVTGASAADGTNEGDVDLSWTNPTNADFANVRITWSPTGGEIQPVTLSGTSRTITGLTPGTAYTFTLIAVDNGGNESSGVDVMITVADPPPDPVTGVAAVDGTDEGDVDLSWTNPINADFANVRITWSPIGGESQPVTLSGTSRTITGLTPGTAYTFTLTAVDNGGNDSSGVDVMITVADPPPGDVTGLMAVDGTDEGDVDLSWSNPTNADFANVRITWSPTGGEIQPVTLSGTSRTITGLTPGTTYTFTLIAVDNGGNDSSGVDVMITVADPPPDPVTGASAADGTNEGEVDLSWTNPTNADFANVRITWSPTGGEIQPVTLSGTSRTITGLTPGTAYTFTLTAVDNGGNDSSGVGVMITVADPPPDPVTGASAADGANEGDVDLSWTNPTNADFANVRITWSPTDGESQPLTLSGTSRTITGLTPGAAYTFTLTAVDNGGNDSSGVDVMITVADPPPDPVTGASAVSGAGNGEVDLSWTNPTNADFANVRITWSPTDGEMQPVTLSGTSRTITGLTRGTAYTFTLIAIDNAGNISSGVMVSATATDLSPGPVIDLMGMGGANDGEVFLSWTNPTDPDLDEVRITWSPTDGESQPVRLSGTSRTITGLTRRIVYTFSLVTADTGGNVSLATMIAVRATDLSDTDSDGIPDLGADTIFGTADDDVDNDGNGLIEIHNLDMLDHVRNNLSGNRYNNGSGIDSTNGCGGQPGIAICSGYELVRDLDFTNSTDYANGSINTDWRPADIYSINRNTNTGWMPIGLGLQNNSTSSFSGIFEGNGYEIRNLFVHTRFPLTIDGGGRRTQDVHAALFGRSTRTAVLRNIGVVRAYVFVNNAQPVTYAGGLMGENEGRITNCYATGEVSARSNQDRVSGGGLVGHNLGSIANSYATAHVSVLSRDSIARGGGLVGESSGGSISNSYAAGYSSVSFRILLGYSGGLLGQSRISGGNIASITNVYATGSASSIYGGSGSTTAYVGGLIGNYSIGTSGIAILSRVYSTGSVAVESVGIRAGNFVGAVSLLTAGSISVTGAYWDSTTSDRLVNSALFTDRAVDGSESLMNTAVTTAQMQATSGVFPDALDDTSNSFELTSGIYPRLQYGGTTDMDCDDGSRPDLPTCGTLMPGQDVIMASGFMSFTNTSIGEASNTDHVFFYDIENTVNDVVIRGDGVNGTMVSYGIEDATGVSPIVSSVNTISGLLSLAIGDEFYLSATFTKDINGNGDTNDPGESFTQRYRFKK